MGGRDDVIRIAEAVAEARYAHVRPDAQVGIALRGGAEGHESAAALLPLGVDDGLRLVAIADRDVRQPLDAVTERIRQERGAGGAVARARRVVAPRGRSHGALLEIPARELHLRDLVGQVRADAHAPQLLVDAEVDLAA